MSQAVTQSDAELRGFELLDAAGVREVNPSIRGETPVVSGAATTRWSNRDPSSEPSARRCRRQGAISGSPAAKPSTCTTAAPGPLVIDHTGTAHHGSLVLLCIGDRLSGLGGRIGAELADAPLRRCRLQMMQTAPASERLTTAIADGDSMRYYPAFDLQGATHFQPRDRKRPNGRCNSCSCSVPTAS